MYRVRRKQRSGAFSDAAKTALELSDQHKSLAGRISELESFISEAPGRAAKARLDQLETIPAPEELRQSTYRHPVSGLEYSPRLSRGQASTLRAERRKNMLVFLLVACLFAAFAYWLSQTL